MKDSQDVGVLLFEIMGQILARKVFCDFLHLSIFASFLSFKSFRELITNDDLMAVGIMYALNSSN